MHRVKTVLLCLVAALLMASTTVSAGIDACESTATIVLAGAPSVPVTLAACPHGDGGSLISLGWYISLTILDDNGDGIPNIPPSDFWMDDCDGSQTLIVLCDGSASSNADSLTNVLGHDRWR